MKNNSSKRSSILLFIAVLFLFAVVLSACGKKANDDDSDKDASAMEPTKSISAEEDETITPKPTEYADLTPTAEPTEDADLTPTAEPTEDADLTPSAEPTEDADLTPSAEPTEDLKPSEGVTESVTPEPTKAAKPTATPKPDGGSGGSGSTTIDESYIKDIAEKGINAVMTGDAEGWVDYTDIGVMYYMAYGKMADKKEIIEELGDDTEDYGDADFGEIKVVSVKEDSSAISKFIDFLKSDYIIEEEGAPEDTSDKFKIEGAYEVEFELTDEDYTSSDTLYVLKINGEWKLAYWLTFMSLFAEYYEELYGGYN